MEMVIRIFEEDLTLEFWGPWGPKKGPFRLTRGPYLKKKQFNMPKNNRLVATIWCPYLARPLMQKPTYTKQDFWVCSLQKTRRGCPVDRRPSTVEAPPIGEIHPFSKMAVTFEPLIRF